MPTAHTMTVAFVLTRSELLRFFRRPARVIAAIGTAAGLWLLLGSGFAESFRPAALESSSYAKFLLPSMMTLVAVFSAVFSSISVIEQRNTGWLRCVLVSPAPRLSIALGATAGGALPAFIQAAILLPAGLLVGVTLCAADVALVLLALALTCIAMTALGLLFAWRSETTAAFHAVMTLVFLPMWLLSGAFFPPDQAASWLGWLMRLNPLTWCTLSIRGPITDSFDPIYLALTAVFALVMLASATLVVGRSRLVQ